MIFFEGLTEQNATKMTARPARAWEIVMKGSILADQQRVARRLQKLARHILVEVPLATKAELFAVFLATRCTETHHSIGLLARRLLTRDALVLLRAAAEYTVNSGYLMYCGDEQIAQDFCDHSVFQIIREVQSRKAINENLVTAEAEVRMQQELKTLRRFDTRKGDRWAAPDDRLYKRAAKLDKAIAEYAKNRYQRLQNPPFPFYLTLVNFLWRRTSAYTHGTADSILLELHFDGLVCGFRQADLDEAGKIQTLANLVLFLSLRPMDLRSGTKHKLELWTAFEGIVKGFGRATREARKRLFHQ